MKFKFKKEKFIYEGYSVLNTPEGTILKVIRSPNDYDTGGILVRTDDKKRPFKQLVKTRDSVEVGEFWGGGISAYSFEILKDKKESDYVE